MNKYILISTNRTELDITTKEFSSMKEAHDEMLKEILDQSIYENVDELIDAANAGEAGYSDDEAWISHLSCDTIAWKIISVKVPDAKTINQEQTSPRVMIDYETGNDLM